MVTFIILISIVTFGVVHRPPGEKTPRRLGHAGLNPMNVNHVGAKTSQHRFSGDDLSLFSLKIEPDPLRTRDFYKTHT